MVEVCRFEGREGEKSIGTEDRMVEEEGEEEWENRRREGIEGKDERKKRTEEERSIV